jgi:hypothetical protein
VIGESMVALVLARAMREKFGGDSLGEMKRNFDGYREQLRGYQPRIRRISVQAAFRVKLKPWQFWKS